MFADIKIVYLATPMEPFEYMKMQVELIPQEFIDTYQLHDEVKDGHIYIQIERGMYGLPQAEVLLSKLLCKWLVPHGYYKVPYTPGPYETRVHTSTICVSS